MESGLPPITSPLWPAYVDKARKLAVANIVADLQTEPTMRPRIPSANKKRVTEQSRTERTSKGATPFRRPMADFGVGAERDQGRIGTAATTWHRSTAGAACAGRHTHHRATGSTATAAWDSRGGAAKGAGGWGAGTDGRAAKVNQDEEMVAVEQQQAVEQEPPPAMNIAPRRGGGAGAAGVGAGGGGAA